MGSQNKKWELLISPADFLADKFLYRALVRVNAYKCAKFHYFKFLAPLVKEIRRGSHNKKVGAADLPRQPLAVKFLYVAIVPANV